MRALSPSLVVDANILVAAARGRTSAAIAEVLRARTLITTQRALEETRRRIALGLKRTDLLTVVDSLAQNMLVVPAATLAPDIADGERALKDSVAGGSGSIKDAHLLALAWAADADIWTTDRDFAGTGVATWSTPNLMRALARA
ncbi:MAG: PIN domain-containing protein [Alphaproteobacteria bacterium]|nr:PIN domain-containing protein [Alphaproteobacteria bacterium]